jgi:hypothetical protein
MGVVVGARTWELKLPEGEKYAGVKVIVKGLTIGEALEFGEFLDGVLIAPIMREEDVVRRDRAYALFASRVVEWNLESESGVPLPATLDGMHKLDWTWGRDFIHAWTRVVSDVPDPLEQPSTDGPQSPAASVPMEPWLESPGSLPEPESS